MQHLHAWLNTIQTLRKQLIIWAPKGLSEICHSHLQQIYILVQITPKVIFRSCCIIPLSVLVKCWKHHSRDNSWSTDELSSEHIELVRRWTIIQGFGLRPFHFPSSSSCLLSTRILLSPVRPLPQRLHGLRRLYPSRDSLDL